MEPNSVSVTRSHLLSTKVSANAICTCASFVSFNCLKTLLASTKVTTASSTALFSFSSSSSSSTQSSCATGPGSANPVVSNKMKSNCGFSLCRLFSSNASIVCISDPFTVQHTHPLFISTQSSSSAVADAVSPSGLSVTSIFSTPISAPNSFNITATLYPWSPVSTWFTRVVFPEPRKPVTTVMPVKGMVFVAFGLGATLAKGLTLTQP
mmetsp:Transcript_11767/g.43700  ORF Transcript_11767/g.43700 Transcript_11767/m.43700 type:complete len:209 (+) Transcript_11767:1668-2294(+)